MGIVESLLGNYAARKLSTDKSYKLLVEYIDERYNTLEQEIDDIRVMIWVLLTKEQRDKFKEYAKRRREKRRG